MPSSSSSAEGRELQQLTDRMGEVERLHSIVARDAAAMKAMGVLVEAKALKLDVHGKACAVSRIRRPFRDAQDRQLWRDKTCPARTKLIMSWKALLL